MQDRILFERLSASKKSTLLLGARQVGKSTLCRALNPVKIINLADEAQYLQYAKDPARLSREVAALKQTGIVVIDETQRIPTLLNSAQAILDSPANKHRFVFTGSSARKLRQHGVNLLPGRVILEHLDPLSYLEVKSDFSLERGLQLGMLPGIYLGDEENTAVLETYAEVYLREEIRAEALARDVGSYARFLDVIAIVSGQWLNYSKISSNTEIPKETIRRYVTLLEDTLLAFRIPSFQPKIKMSRRVSQRDKIFLFDLGVRNALLGLHRNAPTPDQFGSLFEHWFVLQLIYLNRALRKGWQLSSYRTEGGAEVDLVIERTDDIVGVEIKASKNVGRSDTRGLVSLSETIGRYKPLKKWVAYLGDSAQKLENDVTAYPYLDVLEQLGLGARLSIKG